MSLCKLLICDIIQIPRPDGKEDGLGLRYLDEPSSNQSDPTVLELQLRAKSKKLQNGDVVVRSIEGADRNPAKIDKWIQDIADLHRSKPPPQVQEWSYIHADSVLYLCVIFLLNLASGSLQEEHAGYRHADGRVAGGDGGAAGRLVAATAGAGHVTG